MKKVFAILVVLMVSAALFAATISSPAATVNLTKNKVITMDALNKEVAFYEKNGVTAEKLDVLNALIDEILIEQGAARDYFRQRSGAALRIPEVFCGVPGRTLHH